MTEFKPLFSLLFLVTLAACGNGQEAAQPMEPAAATPQPAASADDTAARLQAALAGAQRSDANRARDQYRHPQETLLFFGLQPDMTVIELWPGGGWYTEVLAPVLRDTGHLVAAAYPADSDSDYFNRVLGEYQAKLAAAPAVYGQVTVIGFNPPAHASLGPDGSADMVLTFRNLHNWRNAGNLEAVFAAAYAVLKPGGVFGVAEHRAPAGSAVEQVFESGYMPQDYVIELAQQAGFELTATSEINANPKDTKDYPKGVWTLPPSLRLGEQDKAKYLAIGESDRMTLKFVKPTGSNK